MKIVLLGAPGAGKGTQAARLVADLGVAHVSTGDILRKAVADATTLGMEAKRYMDAGDLVPDDVVIGLVRERLSQPDTVAGFILDGFPRTVAQADALDAMLAQIGKGLDAVVSVDVDKQVIVDRLTARRTCRSCGRIYNLLSDVPADPSRCDTCGGEIYQRDDDTVETVTNRLDVYERSTAPLIEYYRAKGLVRSVDGDRPVDEVYAEVRRTLAT
ncbi:MAG: adenylate kinase [Coriobacteriia bacterium]